MSLYSPAEREEGYTLVESLVAIALFAAVVITFIGTLNNFMLVAGRGDTAEASLIAQTEIANLPSENLQATTKVEGKFLIEKEMSQYGNCVQVTVRVSSVKEKNRTIVSITRLLPISHEK